MQRGGAQHETHCRFLQCQGFRPIFVTSLGFKMSLVERCSRTHGNFRSVCVALVVANLWKDPMAWRPGIGPFWEASLSASQLNFQADMPLQLHVSCTGLCRVRISPSNNVHLVQRACLHRGNGNRTFLLVWQKYGQEKLEFNPVSNEGVCCSPSGMPQNWRCCTFSTLYIILSLNFASQIDLWEMLDVSKGAVLLRNVYKHHRPAISHLKAAHYRGSVGARRYARFRRDWDTGCWSLNVPTFLCCFRILGGELNSQYIHITYLVVDSYNMQYLANIMIYDVFSLVFFNQTVCIPCLVFSVISLLFFLHGKNASNSLRGQIGPRRGKTWWLEH